jgi:large subunit ribosomal protein L4
VAGKHGVAGKAILIDVAIDEKLALSTRNMPGIVVRQSNRLTARDVMNATRVITTQGAFEKLQEALAS